MSVPVFFFYLLFVFVVCCDTFESCSAAKQAQQIKCHVKQKQAWKPPLAVWLTRLNKQLPVQIIHVNGTENENQDLQCIWQHGGYMLPAEGIIFVYDYLGFLYISCTISKAQKLITFKVKVDFNVTNERP